MNGYREAVNAWMPPEDLEQRLARRVLESAPAVKRPVIRPWSLARKALLAAVLVLLLTAGVGATVLVNWDTIFEERFGRESAALPVTETAFQKVNVTSVCDDVTLTVREALGDSKTIYLILDYKFPESVDRAWVQEVWDSETPGELIDVNFYATGDWDWESLKTSEAEKWATVDWTDHAERGSYVRYQCPLYGDRFPGGGGSGVGEQAYDPETGTLTYLVMFRTDSVEKSIQDQPLTLLVLPPAMERDGEMVLLADHPALITFQPEYTARVRTGEVRSEDKTYTVKVKVSPFNVSVDYYGGGYDSLGEIRRDTVLVLTDGSEIPVAELTQGYGGGRSINKATGRGTLSYDSQFREIFDAGAVEAVRVGDIEIPLTGEE